jgi:hypothetical protein
VLKGENWIVLTKSADNKVADKNVFDVLCTAVGNMNFCAGGETCFE